MVGISPYEFAAGLTKQLPLHPTKRLPPHPAGANGRLRPRGRL